MDWYTRVAYHSDKKRRFHIAAQTHLRRLVKELGLPKGSYDLRHNQGGIAVSGEITLHHEQFYLQVCQPATGSKNGILLRTCKGLKDYSGGTNNLYLTEKLEDTKFLATKVRLLIGSSI